MPASFHRYLRVPSAAISDGVVLVPLWAVTTMQLNETYQLPPIGSTTSRAVVAVHDDTISLTGALLGPERFAWKLALEQLADTSRRGSALAAAFSGRVGGLVLVTSMTIRTDLQVQSLSFTASAARREVLDVAISLAHMPLPGSLAKLLDVSSLGIAALADWGEVG
jgi:hypothetical protein